MSIRLGWARRRTTQLAYWLATLLSFCLSLLAKRMQEGSPQQHKHKHKHKHRHKQPPPLLLLPLSLLSLPAALMRTPPLTKAVPHPQA
jgi:NADH:ubiquinone oxidoreductase subunit 5 (subunit L)/multisubunit Na+/H+ antiporter MnhA subunit